MPSRIPCLKCHTLTTLGSYCEKHKIVSGGVLGTFRKAVLARAGGRCEWTEDAVRCPITTASPTSGGRSPVEAHHRVKRLEGGANDATNGVALCRPHHLKAELEGLAGHCSNTSAKEGDGEALFSVIGLNS